MSQRLPTATTVSQRLPGHTNIYATNLHGARAEADHAEIQAQVLIFQALQVAQHLRLGMMSVKDRVSEEGRCALHGLGYGAADCCRQGRFRYPQTGQQLDDVVPGD